MDFSIIVAVKQAAQVVCVIEYAYNSEVKRK